MLKQAHDDDQLMSLVDQALTLPPAERQAFLESACSGDRELFTRAWHYVQWEERMQGFLLDPIAAAPAAPERPFEPGELVDGRFRIVREVARGGMGVVYEAVDSKLDRRIAIKCARAGYGKRLPPEVRHAREISHANVCKIFEIHTASTEDGDVDFVTMEFLEGETLAKRLRRGALSGKEARTIAAQLCAGVAEAHRSQVIHGDLKSTNVILSKGPDGAVRAVITDFGLAHGSDAAQRVKQSGVAGGTPGYMAPELVKGAKASTASDIYALGVILHELVYGRRPAPPPATGAASSSGPAADPDATITVPMDTVAAAGAAARPAVDGRWERAIARCLDPDPQRRFASADQVALALQPPRSRRWFLAAAAGVVLAAASVFATYEASLPAREPVRLAVLPFDAGAETGAQAQQLAREAASRLGGIASNQRINYSFIPLAEVLGKGVDTPQRARELLNATHVLYGSLAREGGALVLHVSLDDARSLVRTRDWEASYAPDEFRHAPVAVAGLVTGALRLPPLVTQVAVNAAASQDYLAGLGLLRRPSDVDAALARLQQAVREDPDSPLPYAALAEARRTKWAVTGDQQWWDGARESEREAEKRNADLAPVHLIAGLIRFDDGQYPLAAEEYRRAVELDPKNGDAYRRLGQAYERNNELDQALEAFRDAIAADPGYFRNYQSLAFHYFQRADYVQASQYYRQEVELAPEEGDAHFQYAKALANLGDFDGAEREIRQAIGLGETPDQLIALGVVLLYESRERDAIAYLQRALKMAPSSYLAWMNLGTAYRRLAQASEARQANERGLALAEEGLGRNGQDSLLRARLAYLCARLDNPRRAESEIAQALRGAPMNGDVMFEAAGTFEALGQRDKTLEVLGAAPDQVIADVRRWPDMAELRQDSRFLKLLAARQMN